jgi:WD40 repeat protein/class 3 adenylate cyclase
VSDETARRNLRHELWRLRKALGANRTTDTEYLLTQDLAIEFNPLAEYWLDVAQLEQAPAPDDTIGDLIGRVALYRGELLPGFYDDWVGPERDRIQSVFENRMDLLLQRLISEQRWTTVVEWAERWIALGQTSEAAYRSLMLAHNALGEPAKVVLDYERCVQALRADLDIEPSADTRLLFEQLTHGDAPSTAQLNKTPTVFVQSSGTVTFLFSDIEGSTRLLEHLGNEYAVLLAEHADLLREIADKHNGHEIDTQGDAFFFAFFRAADAVAFAADAQRALAAYHGPQNSTVRVRMGLHTGEPQLARTGYVGMDVHRAARIGAAGHGGQVLLSETTRALVENELPGGTELRDLGEHKLKDLRYPVHIVQLTVDGLPSDFPPLKSINTGTEPPAPGEPPYKGLEFFGESDAGLFFGREQLVVRLADEILEQRFLAVVVGASGSGKSSVVRAGLIPALRGQARTRQDTADTWQVYVMTPTAHPLETLAATLTREEASLTATAALLDDLAREPRSLHLFFKRVLLPRLAEGPTDSQPSRILLVIDQFEELFTLCHDPLEREQFIDNLVTALTAPAAQDITLVLTIRADFYAHLAEYPELRELVAKQQEYIGPMNSDELRRAVEEPAKRGGWEFEPGLVDLILRDVGDEPGALPLLSHALLETWKRRSAHLMTLQGYHDAGGVHGAIAHTAESTYHQLPAEQQQIAKSIFLRLTELGQGTEDTRRRVELRELESGDEDRAQVRAVLTQLADARLITTAERTVEVAHEALIREWSRLREWLDEDREGLKLHRGLTEAAHEWELMERDPSVLYRGARLAQAREFATASPNALNVLERAFLDASLTNEELEAHERQAQQARELAAAQKLAAEQQARAEEQTESNKRLRQRALFLVGALVLALLLAGLALLLGDSANRNALAAEQNAADAQANADAAQIARLAAEKEQRIAISRELAAASIANLETDAERSILLALQAVGATKNQDEIVLREAEEALRRAVASSRILHTITGLTNPFHVIHSPDGTLLAVRADGVIKIYDAAAHQELVSIPMPEDSDLIQFSADGTELATTVQNGDTVQSNIYEVQSGALVRSLELAASSQLRTWSSFSPDWKRVAIGQSDGVTRVFDTASGKELLTLEGPPAYINAIAYSPDGTQIATATDENNTVEIWDAVTGNQVRSLRGHKAPVSSIVFSPDGNHIATSSKDQSGKIWDRETGQELAPFIHAVWVHNVAFSNDSKSIATGDGNGTVKIWDATNGQELTSFAAHPSAVLSLTFSNDGTTLTTASQDGTVRIWDLGIIGEDLALPTGGISDTLVGEANPAYSPDGKLIAVGLRNGTIPVWDAASGMKRMTLRGHEGSVHKIAFSPDGTKLVSASNDWTAKIWDVQTGSSLLTLIGHDERVSSVAWSPDGKLVATGGLDSTVKVWDARSGNIVTTFQGAGGHFNSVAFSPDGNKIAAHNAFANTLYVWKLEQNTLLYSTTTGFAIHLAFNNDGSRIVLAQGLFSGVTAPGIFDAATGEPIMTMEGPIPDQNWVDYSPDGTRLASANQDGTATLFDAQTGKSLLTLRAGTDPVRGLGFSPDGTRLATADDVAVRVFLLDIDDLIALAKTRVTRTLTQEECNKYLHLAKCPTP